MQTSYLPNCLKNISRMMHWKTALAIFVVLSGSLALANDFRTIDEKQYKGVTATRLEPDARAAVHETRTQSEEGLQFPNASEMTMPVEDFSATPPTRSSFMATWNNITWATGYLLDVSTSSSFNSYVEGYHDLDVGKVTRSVVTGLNPGATSQYRVRPYGATGIGEYSEVQTGATVATTGLTIQATFDISITEKPHAATIEAAFTRAISRLESLFSDPITIHIRFRYATTRPNGDPLPAGTLAQSASVAYTIPWGTFIPQLRADATTTHDSLANESLPASELSPNIVASSANARAVGFNAPPAMHANGTVGTGGPYDGIVTLNSAHPFQFTRPVTGSEYDAESTSEHEIDEVMGIGSYLNIANGTNLRPEDLFSWSSHGTRNLTSSGTRYLSTNGGASVLIHLNQSGNGDFGDWLSAACPQAHPYVQNAFGCTGQSYDVTQVSPEGITLDVIGYDLVLAR